MSGTRVPDAADAPVTDRDLERLAWHRTEHNVPILTKTRRPVAWVGLQQTVTAGTLRELLDKLDSRLGGPPG